MTSLSCFFWLFCARVPYHQTWYFPFTNFIPFPGQTILGAPTILKGTKSRGRKEEALWNVFLASPVKT